MAVCLSVVGVRVILGLHADWHVCRPMNLLTRVVAVAGVPTTVKNGLFTTVSTLQEKTTTVKDGLLTTVSTLSQKTIALPLNIR